MAGILDDYISEKELAKTLDLTDCALRKWAQRGYGPPRYRLYGRKVWYLRAEVKTFLEERRQQLQG